MTRGEEGDWEYPFPIAGLLNEGVSTMNFEAPCMDGELMVFEPRVAFEYWPGVRVVGVLKTTVGLRPRRRGTLVPRGGWPSKHWKAEE